MDFVNNNNIITFIYTAQIQVDSFQMRLTIKDLKIYLTIKDLKIYHKKKRRNTHSNTDSNTETNINTGPVTTARDYTVRQGHL